MRDITVKMTKKDCAVLEEALRYYISDMQREVHLATQRNPNFNSFPIGKQIAHARKLKQLFQERL